MLKLQTSLEGKAALFGDVHDKFSKDGYRLGGNWDYDKGCFDSVLNREEGETIYLRIPFTVEEGRLDDYGATIAFQTPYLIKHVVNIGLDHDESSLLTASFNQFQEPVESDGHIEDKTKWVDIGEQAVEQLSNYL
ncbi:YugN family protein [Sporosarcina sp. FSL W7-1349]|uniref:YugN family protein n=1 Tax=Sporosarcina sp. FSL W7-1349 TaxID=2921561 RepID=UPI0030F557BE